MFTTGVIINGIIYIGFNTIGNPKIIDSFILNNPGAKDNYAIPLWSCALLNKNMAIIKPKVHPDPP